MREWFRIQLKAGDPAVVEIHIIDYVGSWEDQMLNELFGEEITVTAKAFVEQLAKLPDTVKALRVHVNSPGGDVFGAVNIANALRDQRATKGRTVETIIDGMAASAASLIVMAGDPIRISDNGLLMVHNPWTIALGNAAELRTAADELDKFRAANIIPTYQWHSKLSADEIASLMDATTWMDADEAISAGLADTKVAGLRAAASIDPRAAARLSIPEKYRERAQAFLRPIEEPTPEPPKAAAADIMRLCADAGLDLAFAQALLGEALVAEDVKARIGAEKQRRAAAQARATEIRALCRAAKQDDLADDLVAGGMTLEQVRSHLTKLTAKLDKAEIDAGLKPDHGTRRAPVIDTVAIYAERNKPRAH